MHLMNKAHLGYHLIPTQRPDLGIAYPNHQDSNDLMLPHFQNRLKQIH